MIVQAMSVAEVADELYALSPAEFTAARDDRARQARAAGQRDEAAAIKKLARPTASAWLVNQLVRTAPDQIARLIAVGTALAEAQRNLVGERLRELSSERRQVINELLPHATEVARQAGQPASQGTMGEVRATLEAALADAGARAAVQSGRLTKALAYAGIGEVDLSAAVALPAAGEPGIGTQGAAGGEAAAKAAAVKTAAAGTQAAVEALAAAQAAADNAERALESADRELAAAAEQRQFLRRRIQHLERELGQAKDEDAQLARKARQAQRDRDAAARKLQTAIRQLGQAQTRAADSSSR
jgi:murein DD-endopeptidase MepM/ murein hydrolase activator NlpD